jgi:hypothetical protein
MEDLFSDGSAATMVNRDHLFAFDFMAEQYIETPASYEVAAPILRRHAARGW